MSMISARSAQDWAEKLAAEHKEAADLVLREILAAVYNRDLPAHNPDDPDENWRPLLPVMIGKIERN